MPTKKRRNDPDLAAALLELLVFHLYNVGATQDRIAWVVGRQKARVTVPVRGLAKRRTVRWRPSASQESQRATPSRMKSRPRGGACSDRRDELELA
jgi:hypothetical protein